VLRRIVSKKEILEPSPEGLQIREFAFKELSFVVSLFVIMIKSADNGSFFVVILRVRH
jgi:hypothetical protein